MEQETSLHEEQVGYLHKFGFLSYTNLDIGRIVEHSECFDEFVVAYNKRLQRTKRAIN